MNGWFSLYLDGARLAAAILVFASHLSRPEFTAGRLGVTNHTGHSAVVIFFVLSGYVIVWVAYSRETDWRSFAVARAARLYSVAIPALALTALVDASLMSTPFVAEISVYQYNHPLAYLALFLCFGTDAWFLREDAFSNPAYWSLTYEVAYYAAFACVFFGRSRRWQVAGVLAVTALYGPRPWLMAPIWVAGALLARAHRRGLPRLSPGLARALTLASGLAVVGVMIMQADLTNDPWMSAWMGEERARLIWRYARFAPGDWLLGGLVVLNLAAARDAALSVPPALDRAVRAAAGRTFTLYLTHYPLLELWAAHVSPPPWLLVGLVLASAWLLGGVIEPQRTRLRGWLARLLPPSPPHGSPTQLPETSR